MSQIQTWVTESWTLRLCTVRLSTAAQNLYQKMIIMSNWQTFHSNPWLSERYAGSKPSKTNLSTHLKHKHIELDWLENAEVRNGAGAELYYQHIYSIDDRNQSRFLIIDSCFENSTASTDSPLLCLINHRTSHKSVSLQISINAGASADFRRMSLSEYWWLTPQTSVWSSKQRSVAPWKRQMTPSQTVT